MKQLVQLSCLIGVLLLLQSCSDDLSPEQQIMRYIESGVESVEKRSLDDLLELVHEDYLDRKGYNKKQLSRLLRAYFFRHKKIYLFTRIDQIEVLTENEARVSLYVAMAGKVISDVDALTGLSAQIYRFELQIIRRDTWLLQYADYSPASITDIK